MRSILIYCLLLCTTTPGSAQKIEWNNTYNWKMYDVHDFDAFNYAVTQLDTLKVVLLNTDTMRYFLNSAEVWPEDKTSVWMGLYLASFQIPGAQIRKVEISVYGGFLYDELEHTYYQVKENMRRDWLAYLSRNSLIVSANNSQ